MESSQARPINKDDEISDKLIFTKPFMQFWFCFISPFYKTIKEGEYAEAKKHFENKKHDFIEQTYKKLIIELVKQTFKDDPIEKIGGYWDKNVNIDILGKTRSKKIIAGVCKYSKIKAKKDELSKLKLKCDDAKLPIDIYIVFSKSGFSSELKKQKSENVKLLNLNNLNSLTQNLTKKDLLKQD